MRPLLPAFGQRPGRESGVGRRPGLLAAAALAMLTSGPAGAQEEPAPLPDYATCMSEAIWHFEMEFARAGVADEDADFALLTRRKAEFCGTLGIVRCDRGAAPFACQAALAEEQLALHAAILTTLPAPEVAAEAGDTIWARGLYPTLWGVAHGISAGPDCAGASEAMEAWCVTREASLKVTEAVLLWQLGRLLGVTGPAVEAGWIDPPPPPRPVPRPGLR